MSRVIILAASLTGAILWTMSAGAADWTEAMFSDREHDFGSIGKSAKAEHEFTVVNPYKEPMELLGVRSSCGCTIARIKEDHRLLESGERGAIVARVNSEQFTGHRGATLTVRIRRPKYPHVAPAEVQLQVKVNIRDDITVEPSAVRFGQIEQGSAYRQTVRIRCQGGRWGRTTPGEQGPTTPGEQGPTLEGVQCHHPHLTAELVPLRADRRGSEYELRVVIDDDAPPGYVIDSLTLNSMGRRGEPLHVRVEGQVMPTLQVSPTPLLLGSVPPGKSVTRPLVVRAKQPFRIIDIRCDGQEITWRLPDVQESKRLQMVPFTFTAPDGLTGQVRRQITLITDLGDQPLSVTARATIPTVHHVAKPLSADRGTGGYTVGGQVD